MPTPVDYVHGVAIKQVLDLLDHCDPISGPEANGAEGATKRLPYRVPEVQLKVEHPGGGYGQYLAHSRYISSEDVALILRGFLHIDSPAKVTLETLWGGEQVINGSIGKCEHVQGALHQTLVKFDERVTLRHFVKTDGSEDQDGARVSNPEYLAGDLLLVDDNEAEAHLMAFHLRATKLVLRTAQTMGAALDLIKMKPFDVVLCDMRLTDTRSDGIIPAIRDAGFTGPIIAFTHNPSDTSLLTDMSGPIFAVI